MQRAEGKRVVNLPPDCELQIANCNRSREAEARNRLILDNQKLVYKIAHKIHRSYPHLDFDDLNSAGTVGLIRAADRYDPETGNKFSTFAYQKIRGAILHEIRDKWQPVKIQRSHYEARTKLGKLDSEQLTEGAIAESMNISTNELNSIRDSLNVLKTETIPANQRNGEEVVCSSSITRGELPEPDLTSYSDRVSETFEVICCLGRTTTYAIALRMGITQGRARAYVGQLTKADLVLKTGYFYQANFDGVIVAGIKNRVKQKIEVANFLAKLEKLMKVKAEMQKLEAEVLAAGGDRAKWIIDNLAVSPK